MRILVTGGTGFTGKALVLRLLAQGHEVVALDYKEGLKTDELRRAGARVIIGSTADPDAVKEAVQGVEVVHHLAAAFRELNVPETHYDTVNIGGTQITLDAAVAAGARRFIYCSTCGVHGHVENTPADEDAPIGPPTITSAPNIWPSRSCSVTRRRGGSRRRSCAPPPSTAPAISSGSR